MRIVAVAFVLRKIIFYKKGSARVSNWPANLTGQTTLPCMYVRVLCRFLVYLQARTLPRFGTKFTPQLMT